MRLVKNGKQTISFFTSDMMKIGDMMEVPELDGAILLRVYSGIVNLSNPKMTWTWIFDGNECESIPIINGRKLEKGESITLLIQE